MVEGLLEHGLLTTGEAIVFVRLDWRESETLSFHLAEPSAEVEAYVKHADLRTAVAQYLASSLIALGVPGERHECRHPHSMSNPAQLYGTKRPLPQTAGVQAWIFGRVLARLDITS